MNSSELQQLVAEVYRGGSVQGLPLLRDALETFELDGSAESAAAAGGARLVSYKLGQQASDLEMAVDLLADAQRLGPNASRAANLASAVWERNDLLDDREARAQAHQRARRLMRWSLAQTDSTSPSWVTRATTLVNGLLDAVVEGFPEANLEEVLRLSVRLVERAEAIGGEVAAEAFNQRGSVLLVAADRGHADSYLDDAVKALSDSVGLTPPGHLDLAARLSTLGSVLNDRYERGGQVADLEESLRLQQLAMTELDGNDFRRGQALNNLVNAHLSMWRHFQRRDNLDTLEQLLPELVDAFRPGDYLYPTALSNAGLAADELAFERDSDDLANLAVAYHRRAIAATPSEHAEGAGRRSSLAVSLMRRFDRTRKAADLAEALIEGERVLAMPAGAAHEQSIFQATVAHAYHERFLMVGRISDLDVAARLHRSALERLPRSSPFSAALLNNAAIVLSDRFDRLGELSDLHAAIGAVQDSLKLTDDRPHLDRAARLNNLAIMTHRMFGISGEAEHLTRAIDAAQQGYEQTRTGAPASIAAAATATLSDLLSTAARDLSDPAALARLRTLWQQIPVAGLPAAPASVSGWLYRRAMVGSLMGSTAERRQDLRRAAETALAHRPAVALAAARQLVFDALGDQVRGRGARAEVQAAVGLAHAALAAVGEQGTALRHMLAWQRDVAGVAAALAQSAAVDGDAEGAYDAYEAGHAVLLQSRFASSADRHPHDVRGGGSLPASVVEPSIDSVVVTVWCTPYGGAAVLGGSERRRTVVMLPTLTSATVEGWTRRLQKASRLSGSALERTLATVAREAGQVLVRPLLDGVAAGTPLLWCAGGAVASIPLGCVAASDGQLILERHPIRLAPTGAMAGATQTLAAQRGLQDGPWVSVGAPSPSAFPALPSAGAEMAAFATAEHRHGGRDATPPAARDAVEHAAVVHFATHARTTAADPLMNHLLLSHDTPMFADDVAGLTAQGRLAVLSACDTATPGDAHADEALGLSGAFLAAGFPGVVSSLWSVADRHTGLYMSVFADELRQSGNPSAALRVAALRCRASTAPAGVWAAFVLTGT